MRPRAAVPAVPVNCLPGISFSPAVDLHLNRVRRQGKQWVPHLARCSWPIAGHRLMRLHELAASHLGEKLDDVVQGFFSGHIEFR